MLKVIDKRCATHGIIVTYQNINVFILSVIATVVIPIKRLTDFILSILGRMDDFEIECAGSSQSTPHTLTK